MASKKFESDIIVNGSIIKTGGFSSQFLKADGSVDSSIYEIGFSKNTAFNKNFGIEGDTVAVGNDSRIINGQAAFEWGNHVNKYLPLTGGIVSGDIIPNVDNVHSLGSPTKMWRDVYIGPGSLYINGKKVIEDVSDTMNITTSMNQNLSVKTSGTGTLQLSAIGSGNVEVNAMTGIIQLKGSVMFQAGKLIRTSDGSALLIDDDIQFSPGTGIISNLSVTGSTTSSAFVIPGGLNTQFLKANGSIDLNTYSLSTHGHTFASLLAKPTTLAGYGITDAAANSNIIHKTGYATETKSGELVIDSGTSEVTGLKFSRLLKAPNTKTLITNLASSLTYARMISDGSSLYVNDFTNGSIIKSSFSGVKSVLATGIPGIECMVLANDGFIYCASSGTGNLYKVDTVTGEKSIFIEGFGARGIIQANDGNFYSVSGTGNPLVSLHKINYLTKEVTIVAKIPDGNSLCLGADGYFYIIGNSTSIYKTDPETGSYSIISVSGGANSYSSITVGVDGYLYLCSSSYQSLYRVDLINLVAKVITSLSGGGASFQRSNSDIYIVDSSTGNLSFITPNKVRLLASDITGTVLPTNYLEDILYLRDSDGLKKDGIMYIGTSATSFNRAPGYQILDDVSISGNAATATKWGGQNARFDLGWQGVNAGTSIPMYNEATSEFRYGTDVNVKTWLGLNTSAYQPTSAFIQNQNASAQSANMWISGNGIFGGSRINGDVVVSNGVGLETYYNPANKGIYIQNYHRGVDDLLHPMYFAASSFNFTGGAAAFSSTVTAPTFNGYLNGNAATSSNSTLWNGLAWSGIPQSSPTHFLTTGGSAAGYSTLPEVKTALGLGSAAYTNSSAYIPSNTSSGTPIATYYTTNGSVSGLKVRLPFTANSGKMVVFTVRLYQNYKSCDIQFSGYLYFAINQWHEPKAIMIAGSAAVTAVMGVDTDGIAYVWLEGGSYTGAAVLDVVGGFQAADWNTGWSITDDASTPNQALNTIVYPNIHGGNIGSQSVNYAATAGSAIVSANSTQWAGYSYNGSDTPVNTYMMGYGGDNQWHPIGQGNLRNFLDLGSNAYNSTNYLPLNMDYGGHISNVVNLAGKLFNASGSAHAYGSFLSFGNGGYTTQINSDPVKNGSAYIKVSGDGGGEGDWRTIYHSGNFNPANYLPLSGGTLTGTRPITFSTSNGNMTIKASAGGWAIGSFLEGSSGASFGGFGGFGTSDALDYYFIGQYGSEAFKLLPTGAATFSSSVTAPVFNGAGTGLTGTAAGLSIGGNAFSAFGLATSNGNTMLTGIGFKPNSSWDSRPGGNDALQIGHHTGVSIHGYGGYGGVRLYAAGYPDLTNSVLRLEASDSVKTFGGLYSDGNLVIHSGSIGSQTVANATNMLPLTGGTLSGNLQIGSGNTNSYIYMNDADEGQRILHCNSNRIGFLTQAGGWGAWCEDNGDWNSSNHIFAGTNLSVGDTLYLNRANSGSNAYHQLNRNAISTENMFQWNTGGIAKWYLGQRNKNGEDGFSLYNVATDQDAVYFTAIGNAYFRNDVLASYFYGNGIGLTGTAAGLSIGGSSRGLHVLASADNADTLFTNTQAGEIGWKDAFQITNSPGTSWVNYLNMRHGNASNAWGTQLAMSWEGGDFIKYRSVYAGVFTAWKTVIDSSNIGSQTVAAANKLNGNAFTNAGDGWFRSVGNVGWYNETWGGGIYMDEATTVKVYAGKKFFVGNDISAAGDVIAYSSSDIRLKDNIKPIPNALAKIDKIGGYSFDWNSNQDTYTGHDIGVIAQEIEAVLPELVTTRDNGYKAVKYDKLVVLLIQGMKEQQEQINELKKLIYK